MFLAMRVPFVLLGAFFVVFGFHLRRMNAKALSWPSVEGTVTRSAVVADARGEGVSAEIRYSYMVDGATFCSGQFSFGVRQNSPEGEQGLVDAYPVGRRVVVHYDPGNPSLAVIEKQASAGWAVLVMVGWAFVGLGLLAS